VTYRRSSSIYRKGRQRGASLIVALLMLMVVLMLGSSSAQIAMQGEKAARNDRERQIAFQAAEAALMDAELDIENAIGVNSRSGLFDRSSTEGFAAGCGAGLANRHLGLCTRASDGETPVWQSIDFLDASANARSVPYGHFTGQYFQTGGGSLPVRPPRYIIEVMPFNKEGEAATGGDLSYFYRVTAIGFGMRETTQVVLQTFYRKDGN
jgi:type IV pilus assembly protein PilX